MENRVLIRDDQEIQAEDYMNMQSYSRDRDDHTVADGIDPGFKFVGFQVSKTATAELTLTPGRLYREGRTYARNEAVVLSVLNNLPLTTQRIIAITTWGTTEETGAAVRDYLLDPETNATEPRSVNMLERRYANIGVVQGVEGASPQNPVTDSTVLVIAYVLLATTGIVSITMVEDNRLPSVYGNSLRLTNLEGWRNQTGQRLDTIASDISGLNNQIDEIGQQSSAVNLTPIYADLARLKAEAELPDDASDYGADRFSDASKSDTSNVNYLAAVEEGVRFAKEAENETVLQVFNPVNPHVKVASGFVLPAHDEVTRISVGPRAGTLSISQYQYQTHEMVKKTKTRVRIRWGYRWGYYPYAYAWRYGYDAVYTAYALPGDVWAPLPAYALSPWPYYWYTPYRYVGYWYDTVKITYWDQVKVDHAVSGSQIAQTFLNSQDGWLTSINLYFTTVAATGNVDVVLCETEGGRPNLNAVIGQTTLAQSSMKTSPASKSVATNVPFPATFLKAGQRYAIVLTTPGNHFVETTQGTKFAEGTLFYSTDGAFFQGDLTKDLMFDLKFASFRSPRVEVELNPLSLSGGITDIDIISEATIPDATELHYEVQTSDGKWHSLQEIETMPLAGLPPLLHFRAVFLGTKDVMPGIGISGSRVNVSRPRTSLRHISSDVTLSAASEQIDVICRLVDFDEVDHDCNIRLSVSGSLETPGTVTDRQISENVIERTARFAVSPTSTFKVDITGSTSSALKLFSIAERVHIAY